MKAVLEAVPSFARPLVETRLVDCGVPVPSVGCPLGADGRAAAAEFAVAPSNASEPAFGQTPAMEQYSGAFSFVAKGWESYGEWTPCTQVRRGTRLAVTSAAGVARRSRGESGAS